MEAFDPSLLDVSWDDELDFKVAGGEDDTVMYRQKPWIQAIIVCIDCHDFGLSMMGMDEFFNTLESFVRSRVCQSVQDRMSIVLFGSELSANEFNISGITELNILSVPGADLINQLRELQQMSVDDFKSKYKTAQNMRRSAVPLSHLFRFCLREFKVRGPANKFSRRVVILSNRDDPCHFIQSDTQVSLQLARDLLRNGCLIDLLSLNNSFDWDKYWFPIVKDSFSLKQKQDTEDAGCELDDNALKRIIQEDASRIQSLFMSLDNRMKRQRTFQKTRLILQKDLYVGINVFVVVMSAKKPTPIKLRASDHKPIKTETKYLQTTTGQSLAKQELVSYYDLGDGNIVEFSGSDLRRLKGHVTSTTEDIATEGVAKQAKERTEQDSATDRAGDSGAATYSGSSADIALSRTARMRLEGFIDEYQRYRYCVGDSIHFIYASDELVEGSRLFLDSLIEAMTLKNVYGLISWQFRDNSSPKFYCAVPYLAPASTPGLYLLAIPYIDDLRMPWTYADYNPHLLHQYGLHSQTHNHDTEDVRDHELKDQVETKMKYVLENLTAPQDWNPQKIRNPVLTKFWAGLETLALSEADMAPDWVDESLPRLHKRPPVTDDPSQDERGTERGTEQGTEQRTERSDDQLANENMVPDEVWQAAKDLHALLALGRTTGTKRGTASSRTSTKRSNATNPAALTKLKEDIAAANLRSQKVTELKILLQQAGLPVSGRKDELIERLQTFAASSD
ncbi:Ku70/Ku80 amine-terminal alpha/beta domain protein [Gregarina niphandrodes]|uniref:Ku70/Ku80 amine-terminal alpha/beta domain protein n=1 Tax=Gregarina niphandrodes TaxID=110365 RepID=A0A023B4B1_GRENI|nr:Ku70/Ku80 amine-terminal alpha/beta domain protein [Gregarina niphandrodes]EZG56501.1 Ku70/Ku80 amine-terminal alpha/beta domain protein [Gregarina niphandrodes]|eukprot:XP_011131240.1 Ku70/Ku80 amine-terminal alpha/beta domain protein [Gregarina niphandrodes]